MSAESSRSIPKVVPSKSGLSNRSSWGSPYTPYLSLIESPVVTGNRRGPGLQEADAVFLQHAQRAGTPEMYRDCGVVSSPRPRELQSFAFKGSLRTTTQRDALEVLLSTIHSLISHSEGTSVCLVPID